MNAPALLAWFQDAVPIFGDHANDILQNQLWVGDINAALDHKWLKTTGITHILSVTSFNAAHIALYPQDFTYKAVFAHDNTGEHIIQHWPDTTAFIKSALASGGKVLVHCKFGRSRSVATLAAYLVAGLQYTPQAALALIRERRPQASPNSFFVFQLYLWGDRQRRLGPPM